MYGRQLDLKELLKKKSFFLFGPRATGKSFLIRKQLNNVLTFDLLRPDLFRRFVSHPESLIEEVEVQRNKLVVIDEVQKVPALLDAVQFLIEKHSTRFLLTGSSARKLKRGHANLLAGRAWVSELLPLTSSEIPNFSLIQYLNNGGLPAIYDAKEPNEELQSYISTYLREEIQAEALTRNLEAFSRFLDVAGLCSGQLLDLQGMSRDTGIGAKTIRNYVDILKDTLIAFEVEAFRLTKSRKAVASSKLWLFDIGVTNALCGRSTIEPKSERYGVAFEHFIALELRAYLSYFRKKIQLTHWRSTSQFEVDFILGTSMAIEVKSTTHVNAHDLRGLRALREEGLIKRYVVISNDATKRIIDGIEIWPWQQFLKTLWQDAF